MGDVPAGAELSHKLLEDTGEVLHNLVVPEANIAPSMRFEPSGPSQILCLSPTVLTAIDLDDERSLDADEVGDIRTEWDLPAEAMSIQLLLADAVP